MNAIRVVLFPTDFSEYSVAAFHCACSLAAHYGAKLYILHVHEPPMTAGNLIMPLIPQDEAEIRELKEKLAAVQPSKPSFTVEHRLAPGRAADQIIETSDAVNADIIVMGTHGRRGLRRALMGSVASEVLRRSDRSVLTVKLPRTDGVIPKHAYREGESSIRHRGLSQQLLVEHEMLIQDIHSVRNILDWRDHDLDHSHKISSLQFSTASMHRHLERLLSLKEGQGYQELLAQPRSDIRSDSNTLHANHANLCKSLSGLVRRLEDLSPTDQEDYRKTCDKLAAVLAQIEHHCCQEMTLLEKALL